MAVHRSQVFAGWRRSLRRFVHLGVVLLFAGTMFLTAHTRGSASRQNATLPTLRLDYQVGHDSLPANFGPPSSLAWSLDPQTAGTLVDGLVTVPLTNANLVRVLPNDTVAPDLATWKISKNGLVYTFTIRKNARFSNG